MLLENFRGRMFATGPGDRGSFPGRVIPKTLKMVLEASLLNIQHYKIRIKGKVEQSRERNSAPLHPWVVAIEKGAFWSPSTTVANLLPYYFSDTVGWYIFNELFNFLVSTFTFFQSWFLKNRNDPFSSVIFVLLLRKVWFSVFHFHWVRKPVSL